MKVLLLLGTLLAATPVAASAQPDPKCATPNRANDGWHIADPGAEGMDNDRLCSIGVHFVGKGDAVLVARHGVLVYEHYFTAEDPPQLGLVTFDANTTHTLRSVSKSVVSLVLGIAIGNGQDQRPRSAGGADAGGISGPADAGARSHHVAAFADHDAGARLEQEATSTGDFRNDETTMGQSPDPIRYVFSRPIADPPGTTFRYSSAAAQTIARLLRQVAGQPIDTLARATLFEPLGITDFDWRKTRSGEPSAYAGLWLRARDALKIGQLVLDRGAWQGHQVVPAGWIQAATSSEGSHLAFYGYQFWLGHSPFREGTVAWAAAKGNGGAAHLHCAIARSRHCHIGRLYDESAQDAQVRPVLNATSCCRR